MQFSYILASTELPKLWITAYLRGEKWCVCVCLHSIYDKGFFLKDLILLHLFGSESHAQNTCTAVPSSILHKTRAPQISLDRAGCAQTTVMESMETKFRGTEIIFAVKFWFFQLCLDPPLLTLKYSVVYRLKRLRPRLGQTPWHPGQPRRCKGLSTFQPESSPVQVTLNPDQHKDRLSLPQCRFLDSNNNNSSQFAFGIIWSQGRKTI